MVYYLSSLKDLKKRVSVDIRALDDDYSWERWIVEDVCDIDFEDFLTNKSIFTRRRLESNLDEIIRRIEKMKAQIENPPLYGDRVLNDETIYVGYQILAILILEVGSFLPEVVKENALKSTTWEFDKHWEWDPNALNIRRFYLNEFRDKILNHTPGHKHKFVDLKIHSDEEFKRTSVGLEQLDKLIKNGTINKINYINLDCCELESVPEEILNLDHIEKLSLEKNNLTTLPENIDNLKSLKELFVKFNNLKSLPKSFSKLISLKRFDLYGNSIRISDLPYSMLPPIIAKRIQKTKEFLKK